jgi:dTDP-4-amino-4,6-dideoxygalactose transaminase
MDVSRPVPLADPKAENARLRDALLAAMAGVLDGGSYILGAEVAAFEAEMAATLGVSGVVGVASGTDALVVALLALGIGGGDEVIIPSHTAGPTCAAVAMVGAVPVLIDVDPETAVVTPDLVRAAITPRTKAVIVVHLYGYPADVQSIHAVTAAAGIALVEDCAQSQGARIGGAPAGSIGELSCFSFYPTKNLGALGDGGAVAVRDEALLAKVKALRTYGWSKPQFAELQGGRCSRLDEIQAAMLRVKLRLLEQTNARRRAIADRYRERLAGLPLALPPMRQDVEHAYHLFVVRTARRAALADFLRARSIGTGLHYPYAVHQQPAFQAISRIPFPLTETERLVPEILSLPLYPDMALDDVDRVADAVREFFA